MLYVDLQLLSSLYQRLNTWHKRTDLGETTTSNNVSMIGKSRLVVVLLNRLHYLMQPRYCWRRQLKHRSMLNKLADELYT